MYDYPTVFLVELTLEGGSVHIHFQLRLRCDHKKAGRAAERICTRRNAATCDNTTDSTTR